MMPLQTCFYQGVPLVWGISLLQSLTLVPSAESLPRSTLLTSVYCTHVLVGENKTQHPDAYLQLC